MPDNKHQRGAKGSRERAQSPLVAPAGAKSRISTRKQYENVTNSIAKRESRGSKNLWQVQGSALLGLGAKPLVSPLA